MEMTKSSCQLVRRAIATISLIICFEGEGESKENQHTNCNLCWNIQQ